MYRYEDMKPKLFTEEGIDMYTKILERVKKLLDEAGAFTMWCAIARATGDSWLMLACIDYMVEKGFIREVTAGRLVAGQDRVFVRAT